MPEFHQTVMGHRFYESTMPSLVRAVEALTKQLAEFTDKVDTYSQELVADRSEEVEDERAGAAFVMREQIAHAIAVGFGGQVFASRDELVEAIRSVPLPSTEVLDGFQMDAEFDEDEDDADDEEGR
jgi:hypothetical protein